MKELDRLRQDAVAVAGSDRGAQLPGHHAVAAVEHALRGARRSRARCAEQLDEDHYGLRKVKERILEYLAVMKLSNTLKGPILCFVGPAGRGQDVARAVDRGRDGP